MNRSWNILNWNVRGINSQTRWDDLRARIEESNCGVICIQETKRDSFDQAYLRNFSPRRFNQFAYNPSVGWQVDLLLYGMAVYSVALSSVNPPTNSLSSYHVIYLVISFISVTYMGPVRMKIEWNFSIG